MVRLPSKPPPIPTEIDQYSWLLYGEKGIGKSTLAANLPNVVAFFALERPVYGSPVVQIPEPPSGKSRKVPKLTWRLFQDYLEEILKTCKPGMIVIDTLDKLALLAIDDWKKTHGGADPIDGKATRDFGASFRRFVDGWNNVLQQARFEGFTFCYTSHARNRPKPVKGMSREEYEAAVKDGEIPNETQPTAATWAVQWAKAYVDFVGYYGWDGSDRMIQIRGSSGCYAAALEQFFLQPKGKEGAGKPLVAIPLAGNLKQAVKDFKAAWANRLEGYLEEPEPGASED